MVGDAATIKIGSDVAGALAGIMSVQMGMKALDKKVMVTAGLVKTAALGMGLALAGIGIAGAIGVKKATDNFREFEQAAVNAASVGGEVGEEFQKVKENVMDMSKSLGRETMFTAGQTADALWHIASAGYDVGTMVKQEFKPVMDLAAGTEMELARTTHWVASALSQFGLGMEDAGRVADIYAITNGNTLATVEKLGLGMVYVGTQAAMYNDTIEDTTYLLGLMANRGLRGEQSGRGLSMAYSRLADPTAKATAEIKKLGLTLKEVSPDHNTMIDILGKFEAAGMGATSSTIIFGQEASKAITAAVGGLGNLDLYNKIMNSTGFAAILAAEQLDTLKGTTRIFHSALEVLSIEIGEFVGFYLKGLNLKLIDLVNVMIDKVEPAFVRLDEILIELEPTFTALSSSVKSLKGIFDDFTEGIGNIDSLVTAINMVSVAIAFMLGFFDKHPNVIKMALALTAVVTVLLVMPVAIALVSGAAWILAGALASLQLVFMTTTGVVGFLTGALALLGSPIVLIVAAIAFLGVAWATNLFGIRDITKAVVDKIVDGFFWMVGKLWDSAYNLMAIMNKALKALGLEEIDLGGIYKFDESTARRGFRELGENFSIVAKDEISKALGGAVGIDWLDSTDYSAQKLALEGAEYEKSRALMESYNDEKRTTIELNKQLYGFDIGGMSTSQAGAAIDYYRSGGGSEPRTFVSQEEVNYEREFGTLKPGDTYIIVDTINTKSDVDDLDERMIEARAEVD